MWRAGRTAAALVAALGLGSGCPQDPPGDQPDAASRDGGDDDDGGGSAGLTFEFRTDPNLPADVGGDVRVESLRIELVNVQAIGDSAPGDERTTRAELQLEWDEEDEPAPLVFPDAPPGLYSQFKARAGGDGWSTYRVEGDLWLDGTEYDFRVEDREPVMVIVPLQGVDLRPGDTRVVTIGIRSDFITSIDWDLVTPDLEGVLRINPGDPQLPTVRAAFSLAFEQK